jgi:hypothetical protein
MSTIITRNSANLGSTPASLIQGELAINVTDNRLFFGSGSGNVVKEFGISSSYASTASYAEYAVSASYEINYETSSSYADFAVSASHAINANDAISSSYALTASYVENAQTASYVTLAQTASYVQTAQTASYVLQAVSASYVTTASYSNTSTSASHAVNADNTISSSYALTSSYVENAQTASYVLQAVSASYSITASYSNTSTSASHALNADNAISSSYALTASYVNPLNQNVLINGNLNVTSSFTASGLIYPDTDGIDGQVLKTDGNGNLFFEYTDDTTISIKNVSGGTIAKGTPCYITGSGTSGNVAGVVPADAGNPALMPAGVIAGITLNNGDEGPGLLNGFINGVNTSAFASGDQVYVAVGGGYTNVAPTGSALVQKLGNVEKVDASNGSGVINGPNATRSVPNINPGYLWVGNSDWVATATATSSIQNVVSSSFASTASFVQNAQTASYVLQAVSASFATLAQTANTASYVVTAQTASYVLQAVSASYTTQALSSSYAVTASHALTVANGNITIGTTTINLGGSSGTLVGLSGGVGQTGAGTTQTFRVGSGGVAVGGDSYFANSIGVAQNLLVTGYVTAASLTGSHLGNTVGTASWASNAITAQTASYVLQAVSASYALNATNATTASYVLNAVSASFATLAQTANTASYVVTAQTASYVLQAVSASFASTASYVNTLNQIVRVGNDIELNDQIGTVVANSFDAGLGNVFIDGTTGDVAATSFTAGGGAVQVDGITGEVTAATFIGNLNGTASYATQALSASYAPSTPAFPYTGSAEITGSLGITGSFSTQTFDGTNYVTAIEVTDFKRNINDVMGTSSIDADSRTLSDGAANVSVNWETRTLANSSGVTYVDWQNRYLYGPGPIPTATEVAVDWSSRQLTDNNGNIILDWQNATFTGTASFATSASWAPGGGATFPYTGSAEITGSLGVTGSFSVLDSIDAANKILIGSGPIPGSTEDSVNWDSRTLFDPNGNFSVRWGTLRSLYDANASQSIDWNNRLLKFDNGPGDYTVNWNAGILRDTTSKNSIDWQNRQLKDTSGNEILNWQSGVKITGSALISGSLTLTGSLYITGSATLINEGPTILSGSFKVQGEGTGFTGPFPAIEVDDVNFSRKLYDLNVGSGSLDFGNRDLLDANGNGIFNWNGVASTIDSRLYINQTISDATRDALVTNLGTGGHLLNEVTFDNTVQVNDLCYLDTTNVWFPVDQGTNSATRLLGICMGYDPMTYVGQVLLEGDVVVTTGTGYPIVQGADYGLTVFIAQGAGTIMDTTEPVSGVIRRLGYCYHNNGTEWIMKFRPSNEWA